MIRRRLRDLHHLIAIVSEAEGRWRDGRHERMIARAEDLLWSVLWREDRRLATMVYGEDA